jgi:hypothetical protein
MSDETPSMFDNLPVGVLIGNSPDVGRIVCKILKITLAENYRIEEPERTLMRLLPGMVMLKTEASGPKPFIWYALFPRAEDAAEFKLRYL